MSRFMMLPGLRVYYHYKNGDPDDRSDTGRVMKDGRAVRWDAHDPCPLCPKRGPSQCRMRDIDDVAPDGRLLTVDGWAVPLGVDARELMSSANYDPNDIGALILPAEVE